jgi:hypothetical protein
MLFADPSCKVVVDIKIVRNLEDDVIVVLYPYELGCLLTDILIHDTPRMPWQRGWRSPPESQSSDLTA